VEAGGYLRVFCQLKLGDQMDRRELMKKLTDIYYERNDIELKRGRFRVKGDCLDIFPSWDETAIRIELFGDEVDRIFSLHPVSGNILSELDKIDIFPASHYVVSGGIERSVEAIRAELKIRHKELFDKGLLVEAQRLKQRTMYDIEMMLEMGYCKGIENYSRHISGKAPGEHPGSLLDFFPDDFLMVIDESHVSVPQVRGMYNGDQARKQSLVDFGFRLPSALDNRPLKFEEFEEKMQSVIYVSATPGPYELDKVKKRNISGDSIIEQYDVVEQVIRPTGLLDPKIILRQTKGQMDDLLGEINIRVEKKNVY
jgi:Helicase subunit of the DNA excision repair complex